MPSAVAIYDAVDGGSDFILKDFNKAAEEIEGINRDEIIGKHLTQVFPGVKTFGIFTILQSVWKTGQHEYFPPAIYQDEHHPETWRESWVYRLASGEVICIYRDVTKQKLAEKELISAHERLLDAHRLAHIGTWDWEMENDTVIWSEELYNIAGRDPSLPAPTYAEHPLVYSPASWERLSEAVNFALSTGEPYNLELELIRPDGSLRTINAFGGVKCDGNGKIIGLHGTLQDITERKQAELAICIQEANKKLNLLASITRPDIKNKVITIQGFLKFALKRTAIEEIRPLLLKIAESANAIEHQIDFTKDYQNLGVKSPQWLDFSTLVALAGNPPLEILNETRNLQIFADPLFEKVLYNLVDNTIKHGETATKIKASLITGLNNIRIIWEDNGVGIPACDKDKIFDRGFGKNTGLGLFLIREIVSITGITISEIGEPGKGAKFEMVVPDGKWRFTENH